MRAEPYPFNREIKVLYQSKGAHYLAECEPISHEVGEGATPFEAVTDFLDKLNDDFENLLQAVISHQTHVVPSDREYLEHLRGFITGKWYPQPTQHS